MKGIFVIVLVPFFVFWLANPAYAPPPIAPEGCENPIGDHGDITYNTDEDVFQGCIVASWIAFHAAPGPATACVNPSGAEGDIIYNTDENVFQGCTSGGWMAFHSMDSANTSMDRYYKLNETGAVTDAIDATGNSDAAMLGGLSGVNSIDSFLDRGLLLDGANFYLEDTVNFIYGPSDSFTYSAFIKRSSLVAANDLSVFLISNSNSFMLLEIDTDGSACAADQMIFLVSDSDEFEWDAVCSNTIINDLDWHLVTAVYDGDNKELRMYVDGVLENTTPGTYKSANSKDFSSSTLIIGKGTGEFFNGALDDIRIYNKALDADEVERLMGCSNPAGQAGDVMLNESSGVFQGCTATGWMAFQ